MNSSKIYIAFFCLVCLSCSQISEPEKNENGIQQRGTKIFPLSVGNSWEYIQTEYQDTTEVSTGTVTMEVEDRTTITSENEIKEVYQLKKTSCSDSVEIVIVYYLAETDTAIMLYGFSWGDDEMYEKNEIYLKRPILSGEGWVNSQGDYVNEYHCISTNETVRLYDKEYNCIVIRFGQVEGNSWYSDYYYSAGIGLIQTISGSSRKVSRKIVLKRCTIN